MAVGQAKNSPSMQTRAFTLVPLLTEVIPRVLQRPHKYRICTRIQKLNFRTLLDAKAERSRHHTYWEEDWYMCTARDPRRDGFFRNSSDNYIIFTFGEHTRKHGIGFAINKRFSHLITEARGIPDTSGRLIFMNILLHDAKHSTTLICT